MLNVNIRYNSAIEFLFSMIRIMRSIGRDDGIIPPDDDGYVYNEDVEKYVKNVISTMSPMMRADFKLLIHDFIGGIVVATYLCIKENITTVPNFLNFMEHLSGESLFKAYEESLSIDASILSAEDYEFEMKKSFSESVPPGNFDAYLELKRHSDEAKSRLFNLFSHYYRKYYKDVEEQTTQFMKQRVMHYRSINAQDNTYFLSKVLLINIDRLGSKYKQIVLYPSYFYEIGWTQFAYDGIASYVFGYLLEQQLEDSFTEKKSGEFRKLLADDKRIEILRLLDKKPFYSAELAEVLNVSKPTISYHVYKMLNIGILDLEFEPQNKVYLSLNRKAFKEMLDSVYKEITGEYPPEC